LALTRQGAIEHLNAVAAVLATRTVRHIPTEVALDVDDGMPEPCALSLDNITAVPKAFLVEKICRLDVAKMAELCRALGWQRAAGPTAALLVPSARLVTDCARWEGLPSLSLGGQHYDR
jgi:mRNA-degrading endonuclease toxin of MazEF toxin-antitoxin module